MKRGVVIGSILGLVLFVLGAVLDAFISMWIFKKNKVCPFMAQDKKT